MTKPILITGATGFLGRHLVEQLRSDPECPTLRLLNYGPCPWKGQEGFEILDGNIMDAADVDRAMEGCSAVYHLAGAVSRDPRDNWKMHDIHTGGTRNICEAARKHHPEKIVAVSSSGTIAVSREPKMHDETCGYPYDVVGEWHYYLSKIYAEKTALDYVHRHDLPIVVVNPALLLGPGDELGSSTGDVAMFLDGQVMAMPGGGMCFVDARDAAAGLIGAMRSGRIGERYLLGGVSWSFKRIIETVAEIAGKRPPIFQPSVRFSLVSARILRRLMPLFGRSFQMDDVTIEMSSYFWYFTSAKAVSELGFHARPPEETLRATVEDLLRRRQ